MGGEHHSARARPIVGFVGLGRMGLPMATRLIGAGYAIRAYDVAESALHAGEQAGMQRCAGAAEAARGADVVVTMLPDPPAVEAVAHGSAGLLTGLAPQAAWIEMTSSHPTVTRQVAQAAAERGVDLLDAPVSGGVAGAHAGTLTVMAAGSATVFEAVRALLDVLGGTVVHVSERPGDGDIAKTVNNLLSAANLAIASEGLAIALRAGLDPERLLACVNASSGTSNATVVKIPHQALTGAFAAGFTISQYVKDLRIALDVASGEGLTLPVSTTAAEVWERLASAGHAGEDHTAVVRLVAEQAGAGWEVEG